MAQTFHEYYKKDFPADAVFKLFSRPWQCKPFNPEQREYGIETVDGIFRRYKQCVDAAELRKLVSEDGVGKLNVGCVFNAPVSERWKRSLSNPIVPKQREFVIDIDLDDYSSAGFNIDKKDMHECDVHWPLVAIGLLVCKDILKECFGFSQFLCVYSGRRGGHLWVCDQRACELADEARSAIIKFLTPCDRENEHGRRSFKFLLDHPVFGAGQNPLSNTEIGKQSMFQRFIYKFWCKYGIKAKGIKNGIGLLDGRFERQRFIGMADLRFKPDEMQRVFEAKTGVDAWAVIQHLIGLQPNYLKTWTVLRLCETMCTMLWPRPDVSVSTHMNHTLKAPYSVHPGTGRVSVPIFDKNIIEFDPALGAPLANEPMPASFASTVDEFRRLIDHWEASNSCNGGSVGLSAKALGKRKVRA